MTVNTRIILRTVVAAIIATLTALGTAVADNSVTTAEWVAVALAFFLAIGAWLGVGATTPTEPFLNSEPSDVVRVPSPPAVAVPPDQA